MKRVFDPLHSRTELVGNRVYKHATSFVAMQGTLFVVISLFCCLSTGIPIVRTR